MFDAQIILKFSLNSTKHWPALSCKFLGATGGVKIYRLSTKIIFTDLAL